MRAPADPPRFHGAQHRGERHSAAAQPCCDALLLPRGRNSLRGFVICDGAGGEAAVARGAALGARAAWHALLAVRRQLRRQQRRPLTVPLLKARFRASYLQQRRQGPSSDHTMLACLWDRQRLLLAQVGDSTVLLRRGGVWELPLPPTKGEFANQTTFLRPHTPAHAIALWCCPAHEVEAVIAFSDGLEAAFLGARPGSPDQLQVNGSLAELVCSEHRQRSQQPGYGDWLAQSLAAEALAQLSDDDRTLVIASR
jgi:hypothetical protein